MYSTFPLYNMQYIAIYLGKGNIFPNTIHGTYNTNTY